MNDEALSVDMGTLPLDQRAEVWRGRCDEMAAQIERLHEAIREAISDLDDYQGRNVVIEKLRKALPE